MLPTEVEAVGEPVDLERHSFLERHLEYALQVERVLRPPVDVPALRMAEAAHGRVPQRLLDTLCHLPPRHSLATVDACLYPLELGEDLVGKVEPSVREDVALDPAQDAKRRQPLVRGRDLLSLAADVVRGEAADGSHGGRVVANREVLVAALPGGAGHLLDARPSVRPRRVAMEITADVFRLDERRRLAAERLLTQLRRTPRESERPVDRLLDGRVG